MDVIEIKVDGVVLGTIDPKTLKARALFEIEKARSAHDMVDWLAMYAGANRDETIDVLSEMPLQAVADMALSISEALGQAVEVPKPTARR